MKYTYLLLNLFTLMPPIVFSFDKRLAFYRSWKYALPGILIVGAAFLFWDAYFTATGVWQFNPLYVFDCRIFGMPIEEYLFFLTTPFACIFIYESIGVYWSYNGEGAWVRSLFYGLSVASLMLALLFAERLYTLVCFSSAAIVLGAAPFLLTSGQMALFLVAFVVHLLPFWLVNGVLTSWPVLIYDNNENLSIRLGSIPLEDHVYSLVLFLANICSYHWFSKKR